MTSPLSSLPSVDAVLKAPATDALVVEYGLSAVTDGIREALGALRQQMADGDHAPGNVTHAVQKAVADSLAQRAVLYPKPVFNLTGTVLHTNLGRAVMPSEAIEAMTIAASQPTALEFNLESGKRGEREKAVTDRLCRITGAEDATLVNNNAAAVLLVLNSLSLRKEVPVSRGELIEIGGSFRMPDIMARAGAKLVEVGTTNRTHLSDFANALGRKTGAVMKVHPSNFRVEGFTKTVSDQELAGLAGNHGVPFINDLGSGALIDLAGYGLPAEETPMLALKKGADIVTFSGDKLLGGPQAGLIVGRADLVAKIKRNPLKRALRLDKVTLAALDAILSLYEHPEALKDRLPTLKFLTRRVEEIRRSAVNLVPHIQNAVGPDWLIEIISCQSEIGSGALPGNGVESIGLSIQRKSKASSISLNKLAASFRSLPTPVIGRITNNRFVLDLRCLDDENRFVAQLSALTVKE